jgi:hypothetical protein
MYGLIHEAIKDHVVARADDEAWQQVLRSVGAEGALFHGMSPYPDELTYALLNAASEVLGVSMEDFLRSLGRFWVLDIAPRRYEPLMSFTGRTFAEFIANLGRMHDRIATIYLNVRQPSFVCEPVDERTIRLHYHSQRAGMAPLVFGAIEGLAERFRVRVVIDLAESRDRGADHDVFVVRHDAQ